MIELCNEKDKKVMFSCVIRDLRKEKKKINMEFIFFIKYTLLKII